MKRPEKILIEDLPAGVAEIAGTELDLLAGGQKDASMIKSWGIAAGGVESASAEWRID
ncbi:hypothetical protein [Actinomadura parmotrematis]|uniref:Uncharacterized protein n=1 Tax=Actinomadura parmotrematis TaxID=2864039 RepID=A0ABS7FQN8_9ACTN|nr:hypothetical protein [Actinomadura parmotrematis]MBW8481872.1 hypothetical protein [Actinomadura parmotrematis]